MKIKSTDIISRAILHENRLKLHSTPEMTQSAQMQNSAFGLFLRTISERIPKDKYKAILRQLRFPLPTITTTASIYDQLERVFDAKNAVIDFSFREPELLEDWLLYREEKLNEPWIWRHKGFQMMKTSINSVMVVDMSNELNEGRPEPYFYWVDISRVVDFDAPTGTIKSILFEQDPDDEGDDVKYIFIDHEGYKVYRDSLKTDLLSENFHNLGYCPASFFWQTSLSADIPALKAAPISKALGDLDKLLFNQLAADYLDLYASYPIISKWDEDCNYIESGERYDSEIRCDGGYLRDDIGYIKDSDGGLKACPVCQDHAFAGPGSVINVPRGDMGSEMSLPGVTITQIDAASLEYNQNKNRITENSIIASAAGVSSTDSKEAINELQVKSKFESKLEVLRSIKTNFEHAQKFVDDTVCRLRYGDQFIGSNINWGTEFYLDSLTDLYDKLKQAKEAGLPEFMLDEITDQIIETEHKNNPTMLERLKLLRQLEPYRNLSKDEAVRLSAQLDEELVKVKLQLPGLIDRFENENINITEFGADLDLSQRIKLIINKLREYVKELSTQTIGAPPSAL